MVEYLEREAVTTMQLPPKRYRQFQTDNLDDAYEQGWMDALDNLKNSPAVDVEALKIAVVALEKQIPQKPINLSNATLDAYCAIFRCPRCKGRLKMKSKGAYCDKCGGALDWSDDNGGA